MKACGPLVFQSACILSAKAFRAPSAFLVASCVRPGQSCVRLRGHGEPWGCSRLRGTSPFHPVTRQWRGEGSSKLLLPCSAAVPLAHPASNGFFSPDCSVPEGWAVLPWPSLPDASAAGTARLRLPFLPEPGPGVAEPW